MLEDVDNILVSIVIPVYNVENFITECLNSILTQTYQSYEIVLVNDGSTDNSLEICYRFQQQDSRIKVYNKINGGLSSARNLGITKSIGKYIIFLDSDDYWINNYALEHLVHLAKSTNADVVRGEYKEVDNLGNDLYIPIVSDELIVLKHKQLNNQIFLEKILGRGHFSWLFLIKRSVMKNCKFKVEQKYQEDIEFNIRFFSTPKICVYTPLRFYAYRKRENSIMTTHKIDNLRYSFQLSYEWYNYAHKINNEKLKKIYVYNSIMMYYWTLGTLSQEPYYKDCIDIIKELSLIEINKKIRVWAKSTKKIYPLPIYISPLLGIYYFRLRFKVSRLLSKFKK